MLGNQDSFGAVQQSQKSLDILQPSRSKSVPDIRQYISKNLLQRFQGQVYDSILQLPGHSAFFIAPIGPNPQLANPLSDSIFGGKLFTSVSSQEKYLTAHVQIRTHFSRSHEFEDIQTSYLRRSGEFFFYPQSKSTEKQVETSRFQRFADETCSTSTGLTNILTGQPPDLSSTIEDLTIIKDRGEVNMAVPSQYDVEKQHNGHYEHPVVITKRTASFNDLKRKFEETNTMYLPRDQCILKEQPGPSKKDWHSKSIESISRRPRSAVYEVLSPVKKEPAPPRSLSLCERFSPVKIKSSVLRGQSLERRYNPKESGQRWSVPYESLHSDCYSPTRWKLVGLNWNASPRSMNIAAGGNDWPDGIFTKTGDVYKRINNNGISFRIPSSHERLNYPRNIDYRNGQLTVDCSYQYMVRPPSPRISDQPSPCLNYSYLDHIDRSGQKPYRSINLSDWNEIPVERRYTSCFNLNRPNVHRIKRYSVPRANMSEKNAWKIHTKEINGGRKRMHTLRGSWSQIPLYSSSQISPGNLEECMEREVRTRVALHDGRSYDYSLPSSPSPHHFHHNGIDESSISKKFDSNIALFENLAVESKKDAMCTKCSGCCVHSVSTRQSYPSRRLFSTRPTHEYSTNGECSPRKYRFERGGFDRYYGNETVEVVSSPGGKF